MKHIMAGCLARGMFFYSSLQMNDGDVLTGSGVVSCDGAMVSRSL